MFTQLPEGCFAGEQRDVEKRDIYEQINGIVNLPVKNPTRENTGQTQQSWHNVNDFDDIFLCVMFISLRFCKK